MTCSRSAGYHAARVDDIVKAAKTSHGTFYLYFSSKDDLFRALAENAATSMLALARSCPSSSADGDGRAAVHEWLDRFADLYATHGAVIRTLDGGRDRRQRDRSHRRGPGRRVLARAGEAGPSGCARPRRPHRRGRARLDDRAGGVLPRVAPAPGGPRRHGRDPRRRHTCQSLRSTLRDRRVTSDGNPSVAFPDIHVSLEGEPCVDGAPPY